MDFATWQRYLSAVQWDAHSAIDQCKLITLFARERMRMKAGEAGPIEAEFQRLLSITRDTWFRLLASNETDRLRVLYEIWQKRSAAAQRQAAATMPPTVMRAANAVGGGGIYPQGGWLGEFVIDYGAHMESPDSFIFWSGVATLSAVVRRKVWVQFGLTKLFPNFYVILVSKAGQARKGAPIKAAQLFAKTITDVNFIDRTTTERLPHDLAYRVTQVGGQTQKVPSDAHGFLCAEELVTILDDKSYNIDVLKFLIDWWDCPSDRASRSHKHNVVQLKNVHITLLGGTTPEWLQGALSHVVAGGGMLSRTVFVVEERTPKRLHWPDAVDPAVEQRLAMQLAHIDTIAGEFAVPQETLDWNHAWYDKYRDFMESNESLASALERKQIHMIKLAMLIACSENSPLIITPTLMERAGAILDEVEKRMPEATRILEATPDGRKGLRILDHIRKAGGEISWSDLLRKNSPYGINRDELRSIVGTLEESDQVTTQHVASKSGRAVMVVRLKP